MLLHVNDLLMAWGLYFIFFCEKDTFYVENRRFNELGYTLVGRFLVVAEISLILEIAEEINAWNFFKSSERDQEVGPGENSSVASFVSFGSRRVVACLLLTRVVIQLSSKTNQPIAAARKEVGPLAPHTHIAQSKLSLTFHPFYFQHEVDGEENLTLYVTD